MLIQIETEILEMFTNACYPTSYKEHCDAKIQIGVISMKKGWSFILGVVVGVIAAFYIGGMCNFFPFIADDFAVREIGFCTLIVCALVAICTYLIISKIEKKNLTDTEK